MTLIRRVCAAFLLLAVARSVEAQAPTDTVSSTAVVLDTSAAVRRVEEVVLAQDLATVGRAKEYPLALAAAAQLLQNNPIRRLITNRRREPQPGAVARSDTKRRSSRPPLDPGGLLKEAREMARGNTRTLAIIRQVEQRRPARSRGAVGGVRVLEDTVAAGRSHEHTISFVGGRPAVVSIVGDGDTALECVAYGDGGRLVAADSTGRKCMLQWSPDRTEPFRIRIRNAGTVWNSYLLATN